MKLELKKHKYYLLVLTAMFFVLIYLFVPEGSVFGSNTDWMSQHAELAETLRDACLSQGTIFPDFLWLGGGSNAYEFSYYGYLRPDILIGCLLPQVPMIYILIFSMMACVLASGLLGYYFLIQNHMEPFAAFIGSTFLMTAGCFFRHTGRSCLSIICLMNCWRFFFCQSWWKKENIPCSRSCSH